MPPPKRLRCDDHGWTQHKAAIEEMYVHRRLSQKKIRDKLEEDGFRVTKSELEAQLRFWKFRKNASAGAWRYTDYRLLKREQQGKDSVVYYNGRKVTRNTLKKERSRYQPDTLTKYMTAASPKTPEGMDLRICTPSPAPLQSRWAQTLPWLLFRDKLLPSILSSTTHVNSNTLRQTENHTQSDFISLHRPLNRILHTNISEYAVDFVSIMHERDENELATRAQPLVLGTTSEFLNEHVKLILYRLSNNLIEIDIWTEEGLESWRLILDLIERSGLTNQPLDLVQEDDLTIMSIAENLFKFCIEFRMDGLSEEHRAVQSQITSWLLHSGQNTNIRVINDEKPTLPLNLALQNGECELAIQLLEAGADPQEYFIGEFPPLSNLLRDECGCYYAGRRKIYKRLVLRLLGGGASLNEGPSDKGPSALMWAVLLDLHLADILIQHGAKVEYQFTQDGNIDVPECNFSKTQSALGFAMYTNDEAQAIKKIQHLVHHVQQSDPSVSVADIITADVVCLAAEFGFNKVIEFCCSFHHNTTSKQHILFSALCAASYKGHLATCDLLIHYGASINSPEGLRGTPCPLHFAALADHPLVAKLLYDHDANINAEFKAQSGYAHPRNYMWNRVISHLSSSGRQMQDMLDAQSLSVNPLGAAIIGAAGGRPSSFEILFKCEAKLPFWAIYHGASIPRHLWIARSAVEQGADLNWRGPDGRTALQRALDPFMMTLIEQRMREYDLDDCLDFLITLVNAGAETTGIEAELLVLLERRKARGVLIRDFPEAFQPKSCKLLTLATILLTRSIPRIERALAQSLGAYDPGALCASVMLAISSGSTGPLQQLMNYRPETVQDTSLEGVALGLAAWHSRMDLLEMLLAKIQGLTLALIPAYFDSYMRRVRTPSKEDLQTIISESFVGIIPVWYRETQEDLQLLLGSPVTLSIWSQDCLNKLLENDFYPDRLTISVAVCNGDVEILQKLVQKRQLDDSHADRPGPVLLSVERKFMKATEVLLHAGFSPDEPNDFATFGRSPLQKAVEDGSLEIMNLLLEFGADVNAPAAEDGGATALQLAAITGRLGIARRLIDLGADVNAPAAEKDGRTALEGAAEHGRLDMVHLLLDCGANVVGDGCLQYFKAIRFAQEERHMVVAKFLKNHREWGSFDHDMWWLLVALDWERLRKLGSLEELMDSSANSEEAESPPSSDRDGDSSEEVVRLDDDSDYEHESIREGSFAEGRIGPAEVAREDGRLGELEDSSEAVLAGTDYDSMVVEDHMASHVHDDTAWNQPFGQAENEVQTSWNFRPMEAVHGAHTIQRFQTTDFNGHLELNQHFATANQDLQAAWETLPMEGVDYEVMMEDQLFLDMIVDSAWNQQFGTTDWNGPQSWLSTEMESGVCYEIFEGDMDWVETQDHNNQ